MIVCVGGSTTFRNLTINTAPRYLDYATAAMLRFFLLLIALRGGARYVCTAALGSGHTTGRSAATAVCCREMTVYVVRIIIKKFAVEYA
jgi:hypothetical protein